jgi:capsular polysaccharide biosynthesis protein
MSDDTEALKLMVAFCLAEADLEQAAELLQQLLSLCPTDAEAHYNLGEVRLELGQLEAAIASFQTALQLESGYLEAYDALISTQIQAQDWQTAIQLALRSLQLYPQWSPAFIHLGYCLQQQGDPAAHDCGIGLIAESVLKNRQPSFVWQVYDKPDRSMRQQLIYPAEPIAPHLVATAAFVMTLQPGILWSDHYTRAGLTADRQLVEAASMGNAALIASSEKLPPSSAIAGRVACLSIRYSNNYFHWMYDLLPKIGLLRQSGLDLDAIDRWVVNGTNSAFQRDTLRLCGIPDSKLIANPVCHIQADELIVPIASFNSGRVPRWVCQFLRSQFLAKSSESSSVRPVRRLLISRSSASYRQLLNEAELFEALAPIGFERVWLEELPFVEQVALFQSAEAIVAPHGAGLSNIVFCAPDTKLVELFLPDERLDYYQIISAHLGLNYAAVIGDRVETEPSVVQFGQASRVVPRFGMTVNPAQVLQYIQR